MRSRRGVPRPGSEPIAAAAAALARAVRRCAADEQFLSELGDLLRRAAGAADELAAGNAEPCRACGHCCRFDESGHWLYVSTGELALLGGVEPPQPPRRGRCPYQVDARCTARDRRALGCRVFFCDERVREGSHELYERFHRQVRRLHERRGVAYLYVELTTALAELAADDG